MSFEEDYRLLGDNLIDAATVDVGEWHSQRVDNPLLITREITNVCFKYWIPPTKEQLIEEVQPNLPFAEAQFQDRVSGEPLNPPPSSALWPYAQRGHKDHVDSVGRFSHSYPERLWSGGLKGIRYLYGDLIDAVELLVRNPYTRQCYVPIWFAEDLAAANRFHVRVPCTLGYHFLFREGKLNITYFIRSVDFVRHFRDDVYMACRLCQWVCEQVNRQVDVVDDRGELKGPLMIPGTLTMHVVSLHCMEGDLPKLRGELDA